MEKLIRGILDFRKNVLPSRRETFARLAHGQTPDVLFITCSDSRVAPNWFASTDPGDLFVIRNVGNLVPPCNSEEPQNAESSVAAAVDFSLLSLDVADIVVCGHSGCGAIHAIAQGLDKSGSPHLSHWLHTLERKLNGAPSLNIDSTFSHEDHLSQKSVLLQIENLKTYPTISERLKRGLLRLHAWWFSIAEAGVFVFDSQERRFVLIDDVVGSSLLENHRRLH